MQYRAALLGQQRFRLVEQAVAEVDVAAFGLGPGETDQDPAVCLPQGRLGGEQAQGRPKVPGGQRWAAVVAGRQGGGVQLGDPVGGRSPRPGPRQVGRFGNTASTRVAAHRGTANEVPLHMPQRWSSSGPIWSLPSNQSCTQVP